MTCSTSAQDVNALARDYVRLILAVGVHEPDYVDAYYGPPELKEEATAQSLPLAEIRNRAGALEADFAALPPDEDELVQLRHQYLLGQTRSLGKFVEILEGKRFSFDEESKALYDAVAPVVPESHFQKALDRLEQLIPGQGSLADRYTAWQQQFHVPTDKLPGIYEVATDEARRITKQHIDLPAGESFEIEYVQNKVWSGYNWYKGGSHSLIQVNTDLPMDIGRAIGLAAHEGYPGHHVYNTLIEDRLVRKRGWVECSAYALFSPQSLIAEGTAEYGVDLAFPPEDRVAFLIQELFPRAGFDPARVSEYEAVNNAMDELSHARNQAARNYLDGNITREECIAWLGHYQLMSPERATKGVQFIEKNRSYVINYNLGTDLVRDYLAKQSGPEQAWANFEELLSSPRLPSGLV
jgi:hypothetical protein